MTGRTPANHNEGTSDLPLGDGEGVVRVLDGENNAHGTFCLQLKMSGIDWFDKILEEDEILNKAVQGVDLVGISRRMNELRTTHNIIR